MYQLRLKFLTYCFITRISANNSNFIIFSLGIGIKLGEIIINAGTLNYDNHGVSNYIILCLL